MDFDYTVTTRKSFEEAVAALEEETKKAGFKVLYIHDVTATLKEKGFKIAGRHHEIYMSDPHKTPESKLKTIIRYQAI